MNDEQNRQLGETQSAPQQSVLNPVNQDQEQSHNKAAHETETNVTPTSEPASTQPKASDHIHTAQGDQPHPPPQPKKRKFPVKLFKLFMLALLLLAIPVGVTLVSQSQEIRELAAIIQPPSDNCGSNRYLGVVRRGVCDGNNGLIVDIHKKCEGGKVVEYPEATGATCPKTGGAPPPPPPPPPSNQPSQTQQSSGIGSAADGPGGCCNQGAGNNSAEGCRVGGGFNEVCNISNGACASGFSCRSLAGCAQDTDCGPGNKCVNGKCEQQASGGTGKTYDSCASWGYSNDPTNTADPNCGSNGGFSCKNPDGRAVCCYRDGNCFEGQQGNCKNLGGGTIEIAKSAEIIEFSCSGQTSNQGSCSENKRSLGTKGPGRYSTSGSCGGVQIDAIGLCGSYDFRGSCNVAPPPVPKQADAPPLFCKCLNLKIYDAAWNRITNPEGQIQAGQTIRIAVAGETNEPQGLTKARIRIGGSWKETVQKSPGGEHYIEYTIPEEGGTFSLAGQVFNPALGWR